MRRCIDYEGLKAAKGKIDLRIYRWKVEINKLITPTVDAEIAKAFEEMDVYKIKSNFELA